MNNTVVSLNNHCTSLDKLPASLDNWHMKVCCQPRAQAAFTLQDTSLVLISVKRLSRPQDLSEGARIKKTGPSGIETATFWLVAQCLNQLCHRVPHVIVKMFPIAAYQNLINLRSTSSTCITYTLKMEAAVSSET